MSGQMSHSGRSVRLPRGGPCFEDLQPGQVERGAPSVTLTEGLAALHQSILGDRLRLALDATLARRVTGRATALAHPALVCDVAIGQSTLVTQRVIANLFYRGLAFHRAPSIGDTLHTTTEVVALRQTTAREGRRPSGLAVLRIATVDQEGRPVLDFTRCAMLPLRDPAATTGHDAAIDGSPLALDPEALAAPVAGWDLAALRAASHGPAFAELAPGTVWTVDAADVVDSAPGLARATLNIATAHHDRRAGQRGRRLVYGGHAIGIAAAQVSRTLPDLATIVAWDGCDHLAPVFEGDALVSTVELEGAEPLASGGVLLRLRSRVQAIRGVQDDEVVDVLDWRLVAVMA